MIVERDITALAEKKRAEINRSLDDRLIQDPVSIAIMVGISIGVAFLSKALAPKQPMQQIGLMKGTVQLQSSQQGTFIPEIYGAAPAVTLVPGTATTLSNTQRISVSSGAVTKNAGPDNAWNAGGVNGPITPATQNAFIRFVPNVGPRQSILVGFCTSTSPYPSSFTFIPDPPRPSFSLDSPNMEMAVVVQNLFTGLDGSNNPIYSRGFRTLIGAAFSPENIGAWEPGDEFRVELRDGAYHLYHGLAEVATFTPPSPSASVYIAVVSWSIGAGVSSSFIQVGGDIGLPPSAGSGGCKVPGIVTWGTNPKKHSYVTNQPTGGGKGHSGGSTQVENIYYTIDLGVMFCRGPVDLIREYGNTDVLLHNDPQLELPTGVYNPSTGADVGYLVANPNDTNPGEEIPVQRSDGDLIYDPGGVGTGSIQQGASQVAVYPGSATQDVDPTEEADVDAHNGPGSTVAYRNHSRIVHTAMNLQRWQNIPPNLLAVWQHKTLKTLGSIYPALCTRLVDRNGVALLTVSDYDFSGLNGVICRGMLLDGRRYAPAEIIDNREVQDVYNYFTTEGDGQILAYVNGTEPSVTILESELGWLEGAENTPPVFPHIVITQSEETRLSQRIDLSYIDPGSDWEKNTQSAIRKVTDGNQQEFLQVQVTLNADEARTAVDRRIYREYVAGSTGKFTLSWTYRYLYAGYKITVATASGITYVMRLTSITGGIGLLDCEAEFLEPSAFSQSGVGAETPIYNPNLGIPGPTQLMLFGNCPLLRDEDSLINHGVVIYMAGTRRSGFNLSWRGYGLWIHRNGQPVFLDASTKQATVGKIYSVTGLSAAAPASGFDMSVVMIVDIYGTDNSLSSVTQADIYSRDANLALAQTKIGAMVFNFLTATQLPNYPNRYQLTGLLTGRRGTEYAVKTTDTQLPTWVNQIGVSVDAATNNLTSTVGGYGNSGVASEQKVYPGTSLVFTTAGAPDVTEAYIGLSASDPNQLDTSVQFAFYLRSDGSCFVYESGVLKSFSVPPYNVLPRTFKIAYENDEVIRYYQDGTLYWTSLAVPAESLIVDVAIGGLGNVVKNVTLVTDVFTGTPFVLVDDAVRPVPMEITDIGGRFDFQAPTIGQSLVDSAVLRQTWEGGTLKPLAPINANGRRNSDNDLFVNFTPRSRLGSGMIPGSGPPVAEELNDFYFEVFKGARIVRRSRVLARDTVRPADFIIVNGDGTSTVLDPDGGFFLQHSHYMTIRSLMVLSDDWRVDFVIRYDLNISEFLGVKPVGFNANPSANSGDAFDMYQAATGQQGFYFTSDPSAGVFNMVTPEGIVAAGFTWNQSDPTAGFTLSIICRNQVVSYYKNYRDEFSIPLYTSSRLAGGQYNIVAAANNVAPQVESVSASLPDKFAYRAIEQTADGLTPGNLVRMKIYQMSALVGPGYPLDVTL